MNSFNHVFLDTAGSMTGSSGGSFWLGVPSPLADSSFPRIGGFSGDSVQSFLRVEFFDGTADEAVCVPCETAVRGSPRNSAVAAVVVSWVVWRLDSSGLFREKNPLRLFCPFVSLAGVVAVPDLLRFAGRLLYISSMPRLLPVASTVFAAVSGTDAVSASSNDWLPDRVDGAFSGRRPEAGFWADSSPC